MSEQSSTAAGDGGVAEQSKEKAQEAASGVTSKVQDTVRTQVDQRSTQAGEQISTVAEELRSVGEHLRERDDAQVASLAEKAADRAEQAGNYLSDSNADRILGDVEDLGRRQPWLALAGGVAIGVVAARFLKASSSDRYRSSGSSNGAGTSSGTGTLGAGSAPTTPSPVAARPTTQLPATPERLAQDGAATRVGT